ncbi:MAG: hypothetical protein K2K72_05450 [Duncaniella sp.]|nr:hypothetical protein [Duncaniella sp.]
MASGGIIGFFSHLWARLRRAWRSRGHGVHSPFAFRFIRGVLRERTPYYAYQQVEQLRGDVHWHKLLFRLVVEFEPLSVMSSHLSQDERRVITLADSRVELPVRGSHNSFPAGAIELKAREVTVVVVRDLPANPGEWHRVRQQLDCGMTFTNGTVGIVVIRHDLPRQDFEVNF